MLALCGLMVERWFVYRQLGDPSNETRGEVMFRRGYTDRGDVSTNIVILDSCRNNPFARVFRSADRGLSIVNAPTGTIVTYATAPGAVAADGTGRNSPFTHTLLSHLGEPNTDIEVLFRKVRRDVLRATGNKQTPWTLSSLTRSFFFTGDAGYTTEYFPARKTPEAASLPPNIETGWSKEAATIGLITTVIVVALGGTSVVTALRLAYGSGYFAGGEPLVVISGGGAMLATLIGTPVVAAGASSNRSDSIQGSFPLRLTGWVAYGVGTLGAVGLFCVYFAGLSLPSEIAILITIDFVALVYSLIAMSLDADITHRDRARLWTAGCCPLFWAFHEVARLCRNRT